MFSRLIFLFFAAIFQIQAIDVRNLLNSLKPEDKCGQMTQVLLGVVSKDYDDPTFEDDPIDMVKLRAALKDYKIGSILGLPSLQAIKCQKVIKQVQDVALNETSFRIPIIYGTDSIHGMLFDNAVYFPQPINMASSFDTDLVGNIAGVI